MKKIGIMVVLVIFIGSILTGCATIVDGNNNFISVNVNPENAKVTLAGINNGEKITKRGSFQISLDRSTDYSLKVELPNYESEEIIIRRSINGWFWGNILIGGLIGMGIDLLSGNMWTHSPRFIDVSLTRKLADINSVEDLPDKVAMEIPISCQMADGSVQVQYLPITFYKKAVTI